MYNIVGRYPNWFSSKTSWENACCNIMKVQFLVLFLVFRVLLARYVIGKKDFPHFSVKYQVTGTSSIDFGNLNWPIDQKKTKGNTHIWFSEKIYIQFLTRPSFRSIWYHWEILDRRVEHRLEIKGRVQKFFKRAPEHENVLRIHLKINKSEKEHLILENQKVSIQYLNAKTTYIRARGGQLFFLETHNKTSIYKYTAIIGLKQSSRVRTYSLLPCWFDFYNTICCIRKAHELSF